MKVIGKTDNDSYICIVSQAEIEKFLNKYYNKMDKLCVGNVVDLGRGYDFACEARDCMKQTKDFIGANKKIIAAIFSGIEILGNDKEA